MYRDQFVFEVPNLRHLVERKDRLGDICSGMSEMKFAMMLGSSLKELRNKVETGEVEPLYFWNRRRFEVSLLLPISFQGYDQGACVSASLVVAKDVDGVYRSKTILTLGQAYYDVINSGFAVPSESWLNGKISYGLKMS
ncbi:MAG: DUF3825 domain-containing protein [Fibrobacter sp.]|nr:DUF3825 domain-containing protein [Fibrobacter sp.]